MFPANFVISKQTKEAETATHNSLLENIILLEGETAKVYYTDGSQKHTKTSAAFCRIGHEGGFDMAKNWNLGDGMEVADAEVFAIQKALFSASQDFDQYTRSVYIFVDSQAAITRLQNRHGSKIIQKATTAAESLKARGISLQI